MKIIKLTNEEYEILLNELQSLWSYHFNDPRIHIDECGSKVYHIIEAEGKNTYEQIGRL